LERKPINKWNINFTEGLEWEKKLSEKLQRQLIRSSPLIIWLSKVEPLKDYKLGDAQFQIELPKIDYKIRHRRYFRYPPDFCIELKTGDKKGWFYTTDNIIYYAWKAKDNNEPVKNHLLDGYFLNIPLIRKIYPNWIQQMIELYYHERQYAKSAKEESTWKTYNAYVPIYKIPANSIFRFNLDPNPITVQITLG